MLIDSIMGTIDHIYCDNTFHVITEQNHRRNTIVCLPSPTLYFNVQECKMPHQKSHLSDFVSF